MREAAPPLLPVAGMSRCLMLIVTAGLTLAAGEVSASGPEPGNASSVGARARLHGTRDGARIGAGAGALEHRITRSTRTADGRGGARHGARAHRERGDPARVPDRQRRQAADQRLQGERPHAGAPGAARRPHHDAAGRRLRRRRADADAAAAQARRVAARVRHQPGGHRDGGRGGRPRRLRHGRGQHAGRGAAQGIDDGAAGPRGRRRLQGLRQQGRHQGAPQDARLRSRRDDPVQLQGRDPQRRRRSSTSSKATRWWCRDRPSAPGAGTTRGAPDADGRRCPPRRS